LSAKQVGTIDEIEMSPDLVESTRSTTPGVAHAVYLNNASSSLPDHLVTETVCAHVRREAELGATRAAIEATEQLVEVRALVARLIGADAGEIAFLDTATRAWGLTLLSTPFKPGDRILLSRCEWVSNRVNAERLARERSLLVETIPCEADGTVALDQLSAMLDERVRVVGVTMVPTNNGLINPIAAIRERLRGTACRFFVDAAQAVGQMRIDVRELGADVLTFNSCKWLRGPRGAGVAFIRSEFLAGMDPPVAGDQAGLDPHSSDWRPSAERFESFHYPVSSRLGLGQAVRQADAIGLRAIEARLNALAQTLRDGLRAHPGCIVHDTARQLSAIVTFSLPGIDASLAAQMLAGRGFELSVSDHRYAAVDLSARGLSSVLRASPHYFNTEGEIERFLDACSQICSPRRRGKG
jgi:selenocysteine lyase/cysteine desulfurase